MDYTFCYQYWYTYSRTCKNTKSGLMFIWQFYFLFLKNSVKLECSRHSASIIFSIWAATDMNYRKPAQTENIPFYTESQSDYMIMETLWAFVFSVFVSVSHSPSSKQYLARRNIISDLCTGTTRAVIGT